MSIAMDLQILEQEMRKLEEDVKKAMQLGEFEKAMKIQMVLNDKHHIWREYFQKSSRNLNLIVIHDGLHLSA